MKVWDIIISGAGIIGVSLALELRERGADVLVLDARDPGQEASSAAAGMLIVHDPDTSPQLRPLARESARLYPEFVRKIENKSAINTDFRRGAIALLPRGETLPEHKPLSQKQLQQLKPAINPRDLSAFLVSDENSVDPRLLMQAILIAAQNSGVEIRGNTAVQDIQSNGKQVEVMAQSDRFTAQTIVNCQGAWAGSPVRPRKGQMLYLQPQKPQLLNHVLRTPEVYLVPRSSGKILVGATVEDVGYDKTVQPEVIRQLHNSASQFVPALAESPIVASWAGLRPGSPDDLPLLGPTDRWGQFIAGGHFRNGILLAPITAKIMADLITGKTLSIDISDFSPARFAKVTT